MNRSSDGWYIIPQPDAHDIRRAKAALMAVSNPETEEINE